MNSNVTGTGDVVDVRQIRPNMFGKYGRTGSANMAKLFGSAEHSSAKKWFGSVQQKQGSVDHYKWCIL